MVSLNKDKNYGTVPQLHHRQVLNNNIKDRQVNDPNGSKRPAPANLDSSKAREVEHYEIREVLRCILHTIIFHRALGLVRPKDIDLELFEITYVQCGDLEVEKKIDEKIEQFISWVEKHPNKKSQWYVNLNVAQLPKAHSNKSHHSKVVFDPGESASEERSVRRAALEASLRDVLFQIIKFVNEKKDHVPSISEGVIYFPYEITIPSFVIIAHADMWKFIGFCFWDGYDQENAPDRASNHAQLKISISDLNNWSNSEGFKPGGLIIGRSHPYSVLRSAGNKFRVRRFEVKEIVFVLISL
ncbi:Autophagy-related protein 101 [Citrus sinensis]|uniref:Autophagy-related protein 101 n=1 Tax=Citrus sinensis TaxID=2711 RepID=A0ACB8J2C6_CITSI|nr:Autophagy-related protein 101 [Citrus sinensis]